MSETTINFKQLIEQTSCLYKTRNNYSDRQNHYKQNKIALFQLHNESAYIDIVAQKHRQLKLVGVIGICIRPLNAILDIQISQKKLNSQKSPQVKKYSSVGYLHRKPSQQKIKLSILPSNQSIKTNKLICISQIKHKQIQEKSNANQSVVQLFYQSQEIQEQEQDQQFYKIKFNQIQEDIINIRKVNQFLEKTNQILIQDCVIKDRINKNLQQKIMKQTIDKKILQNISQKLKDTAQERDELLKQKQIRQKQTKNLSMYIKQLKQKYSQLQNERQNITSSYKQLRLSYNHILQQKQKNIIQLRNSPRTKTTSCINQPQVDHIHQTFKGKSNNFIQFFHAMDYYAKTHVDINKNEQFKQKINRQKYGMKRKQGSSIKLIANRIKTNTKISQLPPKKLKKIINSHNYRLQIQDYVQQERFFM